MSHVPTSHNTHVHWGRILAWASMILLAFVLGFCVAPGDQIEGVNPQDHERLRGDLASVLQENSDLRSHVEALQVQVEQQEQQDEGIDTPNNPPRDPFAPVATEPLVPPDGETSSPAPAITEEEMSDALEGSDEYVVASGDTIASIAVMHYGDAEFADLIIEANDITDPTTLEVGDVLVLPPP